jgi:NADH dehydrogenase (ubiquinone) 1 alpha subcomplex subunit 12
MDEIKLGVLVGTDSKGNKYYENKEEVVLGKDRWVEYSQTRYPKDASDIPPEWHAWLHRLTDIKPNDPNFKSFYLEKASYAWKNHMENFTGTDKCYRPYNTLVRKVSGWDGSVWSRKK